MSYPRDSLLGRRTKRPRVGAYEKVVAGQAYIVTYAIGAQADRSERVVILRVIHEALFDNKPYAP